MDFSLVFLVVLALTGAANINAGPVGKSSELQAVFKEFVALVPKDKVTEIFTEYVATDPEVQGVIQYVQTEDFKNLVKKIESIGDVISFYDYLQNAGLDIYATINKLHQVIGLPPLEPGKFSRNVEITGGVTGLIADIKAVLPVDKIKALYHEKLETSPAFAELVEHFKSPRFQELINALRANEEFQKILKAAKEVGVDVKAIVDLLSTVLGLEFPESRTVAKSSELHQVLEEFVALVPKDKVIEIVSEYLENDAQVQAVSEYVQTEDFKNLVKKVESIDDVINFYVYLHTAGLDIYSAVNKLHALIGLPPLVPQRFARHVRITGGVSGLIADIKAVLPVDKIKALYHEKLETSPAFAELVEHFKSPRFQELINALRVNKEFQKIVKAAKEAGVDVKAIVDLLSTLLGLEFPESRNVAKSSELHQVLEEFVALVPKDKVIEIVAEYLENDAQVQAVSEYVQTEDFKNLVKKVESIDDVINFYVYLHTAGLDIYSAVNKLHALIGLPPLVPQRFARDVRITGGVTGLIADIKAVLPVDKIKALYHEKLETSPAFAELVEHFKSPRFQELINALRVNKEFQKIVKSAKKAGVDVKAIVDLLSTLLGLEFPESRTVAKSSELHQVLEEFVALVPKDKVIEIVSEYLENDAQVQAVSEYVQTEDFKNLVKKVESIDDVINFYVYLHTAGLDIYSAVNKLHALIGLPPLVPQRFARHVRITGGVSGLIADIKAVLPVDKIKALYHEKLETSPAFAELVEHFKSPRFQELINALRANKEFQKIVKAAKEAGVDVKAIVDLLTTLLGLEFPESRAVARSSELHQVLEEFVALVSKDKVHEIFFKYLELDQEVVNVLIYVQTDDFKNLLQKVESIDDVISFYDYLQNAGLDIYAAVNEIHELLGLPPLEPGRFARSVEITGGVAGLIADIKAVLPVDKIKALYHEKLETSPAFAELVEHFKSPRFQELINALRANKEFQKIVKVAKQEGVDVKAIADLLATIFGLEFPDVPTFKNVQITSNGLSGFRRPSYRGFH